MTIAIIDSDSIVYASAGAAQKKHEKTGELIISPVSHACSNAKKAMLSILEKTRCNDYRAILTESNDVESFRLKLYPDYKANRKKYERPIHYHAVRDYLVTHWDAEVVGEVEADDAVCILQYEYTKRQFYTKSLAEGVYFGKDINKASILCGIDKDLNQVPGFHFNYQKNTFSYITPLEGLKSFYLQILTGDVSDNIPGIKKGWRKAETAELIDKALNETEVYSVIVKEYKKIFTKLDNDAILKEIAWRAELLYLRKFYNDKWEAPVYEFET